MRALIESKKFSSLVIAVIVINGSVLGLQTYQELPSFVLKYLSLIDSFIVYMFLEGEGTINVNEYSETFKEGDTVLIPALIKNIEIKSQSAIFLEVYIP